MDDPLLAALEQRFEAMFAALAAGEHLPPATRLRTEGMMEAAVLLERANPAQLQDVMARCYQAATGRAFDDEFGADWREFFRFPQIPAMGERAPVYPSTRE